VRTIIIQHNGTSVIWPHKNGKLSKSLLHLNSK